MRCLGDFHSIWKDLGGALEVSGDVWKRFGGSLAVSWGVFELSWECSPFLFGFLNVLNMLRRVFFIGFSI